MPGNRRVLVAAILLSLNLYDFYYVAVFEDGPLAGRQALLNQISLAPMGIGQPRLHDRELLEPLSDG